MAQNVDLYIPRKCSWTNRILRRDDRGAVQINVGHVDEKTGMVRSFRRQRPGIKSKAFSYGKVLGVSNRLGHVNALPEGDEPEVADDVVRKQAGPLEGKVCEQGLVCGGQDHCAGFLDPLCVLGVLRML